MTRRPDFFKTSKGKIQLPIFFPDATRAIVRTIDSEDLRSTQTKGVLVNTFHLYEELGKIILKKFGGIRNFMNWNGGIISDSGGFQVMSLIKKSGKKENINDKGVSFKFQGGKSITLTPETSIDFQMSLKTDMVVVLDEFTDPKGDYESARESVERTILWAKRSKEEFEKVCKKENLTKEERPYILGVVQGGRFLDLRIECTKRLVEIGFDGLGYGGWPFTEDGKFDLGVAKCMSENSPKDYFLYGLGIGKPHEILECVKLGFNIFDCVLPTRDARHRRLYVYNASSMDKIDIEVPNFYSYYTPDKQKYYSDTAPVSSACDCLLCRNYSRSYLSHLFKIQELTALRLSTIHNLRFYSILMEKLIPVYNNLD